MQSRKGRHLENMSHRIYLIVIFLTCLIPLVPCTSKLVGQRYNEHVNPYDVNQTIPKHQPPRELRTNLWFRDGNQFRSTYDYRHYGPRGDWLSSSERVSSVPSSVVSNVQMDAAGAGTSPVADRNPGRGSLFWAPQGVVSNEHVPSETAASRVTTRKRWDYFKNFRQLGSPRTIQMTARTEPPSPMNYIPEDTYPRRMIWNERGQFWGYGSTGRRDVVANDQAYADDDADDKDEDDQLMFPYDSDRAQLESDTCIPPFCIPIDCGDEREGGRCRTNRVTLSCSGSECGPGCPTSKRCLQNDFACQPGTYGPQCRVLNASLCWQDHAMHCPFGCTRSNDTQAALRCVCNPWSTDPEHNRSCVPIDLEVFQCPQGCHARGRCDPQTRKCQCYPGYEGPACDREAVMCPQGLTGPGCKQDIDECLSGESECEQRCQNEFGTYRCECYDGYEVDPANPKRCVWVGDCSSRCVPGQGDCDASSKQCVCKPGFEGQWCETDLDECVLGTHKCDQVCVNTPGSYECRCHEGYTVSTQNPHWCDPVRCEPACVVNQGTCGHDRRCVCRPGFTGVDCGQDVDECTLGQHTCQHACVNTHGSFRCTCHAGHRPHPLDPNRCVSDVCDPACVIGQAQCEGRACVHGRCRRTEDNGTLCDCDPGYEGTLCERDVDECARNPCAQLCYNTPGSFVCACQPGFQLSPVDNRTCVSDTELCGSGCLNGGICVPGTGRCDCPTGYEGPRCEIETNLCQRTNQCEHLCIADRDGTFRCECNPGYQLAPDGRSCQPSMACPGGCENGGHCFRGRCLCPSGFEGARCEQDQDECSLPAAAHGCTFECVNTHGSYECACPEGYRQLSDKRTCVRSPTASVCNPPCRNGGVCRENGRCECLRGYEGPDCSVDIDECAGLKPCDPDFGECRNTPGSFECSCKPGYRLMVDGRHCIAESRAQHAPHLVFRGRGQKGIVVADRNPEPILPKEPSLVMNMHKRSVVLPPKRTLRRKSVSSVETHSTNNQHRQQQQRLFGARKQTMRIKGDVSLVAGDRTPRASFTVYRVR